MGNLGNITSGPNISCTNCGRVYTVKWEQMGIKERGMRKCSCREVLHEWNSASDPEFILINNPNKKPTGPE